jgi:outer membrane protein assembly factor BamD
VERRVERFRDAIDEYYAFQNEFPESQYMKEAKSIFNHSERVVAHKGDLNDDKIEIDETKKTKHN